MRNIDAIPYKIYIYILMLVLIGPDVDLKNVCFQFGYESEKCPVLVQSGYRSSGSGPVPEEI